MLNRFRGLIVPPIFADNEKTRIARLLHRLLIAVALGAALSTIATGLAPATSARALFPLIILILDAVCFVTLYRAPKTASFIFVGALWLITTLSVSTSAGVRTDSFEVYILVVILAAILVKETVALGFTLITIILGVGLYLAERAGYLFGTLPTGSPESALTVHVTVLLGAATMLYLTARSIRSTFERLQRADQDLNEHNRRLVQEEEKYRLLFENTGMSVVIYERDGTIRLVNGRFARSFGKGVEDFLGKSLFAVLPDELATFHRRETERVAATGRGVTEELAVAYSKQWFLASTQPMFDTNGKLSGLQFTAQDITSRKQLEAQEQELASALEKATFLSEFLGTISHDIKTPLTVINTSLYLLEKNSDPDIQHDKIQRIKEQTQVVEKFIQDILTVSRLDFLPKLELGPVDLNRMLSNITKQLYVKADGKQIATRLDLSADIPAIVGDSDELERAFTNLIDNAINYTPSAGSVTIRTERPVSLPNEVIIEVADTGIGIGADDVPHIFERFYRSPEARAQIKTGTGLGLAIVKKILDMHGSTIEVISAPGQGTTFRTHLPLAPTA